MKTGAEVTGPHSPVPFFVIPTSWNCKYQMKSLCGQVRTPEFCCTFSVEPGYRCTSSRPFHPCESFPWVITFLFMEPILALLKKLPTINAAKIACSAGGKAVPRHSLGELEPAERNIISPWTLRKTKTLLVMEKFIGKSWCEWQRDRWAC